VVADFDGTACTVDVSEVLLERFADPSWPGWDERVERGEIGLREAMRAQAGLLRGDGDAIVAYGVEHGPLDPTFAPFVAWAEARGLAVTVVSDGFGSYIGPILEAAGIGHLEVLANRLVFDGDGGTSLDHPHPHPDCLGCGTCKMLAVLGVRERCGPVAFVGDGASDRYGALYADLVFAKGDLAAICERDGVPFLPWSSFDDVRAALARGDEPPGPVAPARCPGWRTAGAGA
jgi:2,3-diketo-5-methylthio-1-phosphopentane phosphatase